MIHLTAKDQRDGGGGVGGGNGDDGDGGGCDGISMCKFGVSHDNLGGT